MNLEISVVGGGSFGTTIANILALNNHHIKIYTIENEVFESINNSHKNSKYFPHIILNKNITAYNNPECFYNDDLIFITLPSKVVIDFFGTHKVNPNCILVNLSKGFGKNNMLIPQELSSIVPNRIVSFKGPSFANELSYNLPTSFTVASKEENDFTLFRELFPKEIVALDYTGDVNGAEFLSIIKNAYSIVIGIVDAVYNSANCRFLVFCKVLKEIKKLLEYYGGNQETIFNYCGIGDLCLTSLNDLSRNRTLGLLIGKGFFSTTVSSTIVLEGIRALKTVHNFLSEKEQLAGFPILANLNKLVDSQQSVQDFVDNVIIL